MTHWCHDCTTEWFDNYPRGLCPNCESNNVSHSFDEEGDHYEEE